MVNLKHIMVSERSQTQRAKYCMIQFWKRQIIETDNRSVVSHGWRLAGEVDHKGVEEGRFGDSES